MYSFAKRNVLLDKDEYRINIKSRNIGFDAEIIEPNIIEENNDIKIPPATLKRILKLQPNLVIIPDAGTNSAKWENEILDNNIDLTIIDHHDPTNEVCKRAIIVNNTMNRLDCNVNLSGTGVTFKVLQALDMDMNTKYSNNFIDLVGLSIISDSMDVRTYENRWYRKS